MGGDGFASSGMVGIRSGGRLLQRLPFPPSALIFSWALRSDAGAAGTVGGLGFAAAGSGRIEVTWSAADGVPRSQTRSWADYAPDRCDGSPGAGLQATVALLPDGFAVTWPVDRPDAVLQYLAFGGVRAYCGKGVLAPSSWEQPFEDAGFSPSAVLVAPTLAEPSGSSVPGLLAGFGVATDGGQAASSYLSPDGSEPGLVRAAQRWGAALVVPDVDSDETHVAQFECRDKGFTLRWQKPPASDQPFGYLALADVDCVVGSGSSSGAVGEQPVRQIRLAPQALLFFTWGLGPSAASKHLGRLCLGVATGAASTCTSWDYRNVFAGSTLTHAHASSSSVVLVTDSRGGEPHAEADLRSLDHDGFTLRWVRADGVRRELNWAAFELRR